MTIIQVKRQIVKPEMTIFLLLYLGFATSRKTVEGILIDLR